MKVHLFRLTQAGIATDDENRVDADDSTTDDSTTDEPVDPED